MLASRPMLDRLHRALVSRPRTDLLAQALSELCGRPSSVLDVGAGRGDVGARIAALTGAHVLGVDVQIQPGAQVETQRYDGAILPFPAASFEIVLLSDVLHHAASPRALLAEAMRVASRAVVIKDHFAFGPLSEKALTAYDVIGNRATGVLVRGTYLSPTAWRALFADVGAELEALRWPLDVHSPWVRTFSRSELQFAARLRRVATPEAA